MSENADEIKNANLIDESPSIRVDNAINNALAVCMKRLQNKMIEIESEASFQHHLALLIRDYLQFFTLSDDEKFIISLEKKYELNGHNNYVDIVIEYKNDKFEREYLIELKFKKESQKAEPQNVIECFKDIYNLEQLANRQNRQFEDKEIKFCYFIFLTNHKLYTEKPSNEKDIRNSFPMWDKETIKANQSYNDSKKTAKNSLEKYKNELKFKNNYQIEYKKIETHKNKNLWFFKLKIPPK